MKAVKEKYNEDMIMHQNFLKGTESEIQSNLDKFTRFEKSKLKRFFFVVLIASCVSSGVAALTANYVTDKYLQQVEVNDSRQIILKYLKEKRNKK